MRSDSVRFARRSTAAPVPRFAQGLSVMSVIGFAQRIHANPAARGQAL